MRTIEIDVTVEDLIAFNQHFLRKRIAYLFGGLFLVLQSIQLIGAISSGDFYSFWYTTGVVIFLGLLLWSSVYKPGSTAILTTALIAIVACMFLFVIDVDFPTKITSIVALMPMLVIGYFGILARQWYKHFYGGKNDSVGQRILTFNSEGIREKSSLAESSQSWPLVGKVEQDRQNVYVFIGRGKAHVIPKRFFNNTKEVENFIAEIGQLKGTTP
jgi:hypothetical protein